MMFVVGSPVLVVWARMTIWCTVVGVRGEARAKVGVRVGIHEAVMVVVRVTGGVVCAGLREAGVCVELCERVQGVRGGAEAAAGGRGGQRG